MWILRSRNKYGGNRSSKIWSCYFSLNNEHIDSIKESFNFLKEALWAFGYLPAFEHITFYWQYSTSLAFCDASALLADHFSFALLNSSDHRGGDKRLRYDELFRPSSSATIPASIGASYRVCLFFVRIMRKILKRSRFFHCLQQPALRSLTNN